MFEKKQPTSYLATTSAYKQFRTLKIVGIMAGAFFIIGSLGTIFFLYRSVYIPIGESENLAITEPLSVQVIDFHGVDQVEQQWKEKSTMDARFPTHNPFYPTSTTSTPGVTPAAANTPSSSEQPPSPLPSTPPSLPNASNITVER